MLLSALSNCCTLDHYVYLVMLVLLWLSIQNGPNVMITWLGCSGLAQYTVAIECHMCCWPCSLLLCTAFVLRWQHTAHLVCGWLTGPTWDHPCGREDSGCSSALPCTLQHDPDVFRGYWRGEEWKKESLTPKHMGLLPYNIAWNFAGETFCRFHNIFEFIKLAPVNILDDIHATQFTVNSGTDVHSCSC